MSEDEKAITDGKEKDPGFCAATCMDHVCLEHEIAKPDLKTSDIYATCNLPKRFEHPHWFNKHGCQMNKQHPFYRTTTSVYGWYPPGYASVPTAFFPAGQRFTNHLAECGLYSNFSLNTAMDPKPYI